MYATLEKASSDLNWDLNSWCRGTLIMPEAQKMRVPDQQLEYRRGIEQN